MSTESINQGKGYVLKRIKEEAAKKNLSIEKDEWKTTPQGKFVLEIRSGDRIADKIFKEEELLYCQTKNQYIMNVEAKIISIVLQLTK